jgi:hypothetical protein
MLTRPTRGTEVSRPEDRAASARMPSLPNSLWDSNLRLPSNPAFVALPLPLEGVLHDSGSSMKHLAALFAGFALCAATLPAQSSTNNVPESHRPPPGMCRIWIDGVPPTHQPAPTDCATAIRKRPLNARVVFGSEATGKDRTFTPVQPERSNFSTPDVPSRADQDRVAQQQRDAQLRDAQLRDAQQREAQERVRAEAQRAHEEQEKRAASQTPPAAPPRAQDRPPERTQQRPAPAPRTQSEKPQRPPRSVSSARRPG